MSSIRIDKPFLKKFTKEAQRVLEDLAATYGIDSVTYKGGSYDANGGNATLKFEIAAPDPTTGETLSAEAQEFKALAHVYGLNPEDLGTEFKVRGTVYKITGLKNSRPKYPISAIRVSDGKAFKFPAATVKSFPVAPPAGLNDHVRGGFIRLVGELSPENLSCDGECSDAEVTQRRSNIMRQWRELERRAGQKVTEDEAWRFRV
jgi:hypothetical protein